MSYLVVPYFDDEVTPDMKRKYANRLHGFPSYCREECTHRDCAEIRELRKKVCDVCKNKLLPGEAYIELRDRHGVIVHMDCYEVQ